MAGRFVFSAVLESVTPPPRLSYWNCKRGEPELDLNPECAIKASIWHFQQEAIRDDRKH